MTTFSATAAVRIAERGRCFMRCSSDFNLNGCFSLVAMISSTSRTCLLINTITEPDFKCGTKTRVPWLNVLMHIRLHQSLDFIRSNQSRRQRWENGCFDDSALVFWKPKHIGNPALHLWFLLFRLSSEKTTKQETNPNRLNVIDFMCWIIQHIHPHPPFHSWCIEEKGPNDFQFFYLLQAWQQHCLSERTLVKPARFLFCFRTCCVIWCQVERQGNADFFFLRKQNKTKWNKINKTRGNVVLAMFGWNPWRSPVCSVGGKNAYMSALYSQ